MGIMDDPEMQAAMKEADRDGSGGDFFKLSNDGDSGKIRVTGPAAVLKQVWADVDEGRRPFATDSPEGLAAISAGVRPQTRWRVPVLNVGTGEEQTWDVGKTVFVQLCNILREYAPEKHVYKVKRRGAAGDKNTTYTIIPEIATKAKDRDREPGEDDEAMPF